MPKLKRMNSLRVQRMWRHLLKVIRTPAIDPTRTGEGFHAHPGKIVKYGKAFIHGFTPEKLGKGNVHIRIKQSMHESPVSAIVYYRSEHRFHAVGRMKLGFTPTGVVVEGIQGAASADETSELNTILGQPWANQLIQTIEKNARKAGYKQLLIRIPAHNYWYAHPRTGYEEGSAIHESIADGIRERMNGLYGRVAKANGFHKSRGFFIKDL